MDGPVFDTRFLQVPPLFDVIQLIRRKKPRLFALSALQAPCVDLNAQPVRPPPVSRDGLDELSFAEGDRDPSC
jgi:hypothetical protein